LQALRDRQPLLFLVSLSLLVGTFVDNTLAKGLAVAAFGSFLLALLVSLFLAIKGREEVYGRFLGPVFVFQLGTGLLLLALTGAIMVSAAGPLALLSFIPFWFVLYVSFGAFLLTEFRRVSRIMPRSRALKLYRISCLGLLFLLPARAVDALMIPPLVDEYTHRFVSGWLSVPNLVGTAFFGIWLFSNPRLRQR
jgi:uncharacterized integral membrane protein